MEHFTFGRNNGLRVSALALGAGNFGRAGATAPTPTTSRMFERFADAGGTFIDTAASYQVGEAEENLGRLLDGRRDPFTIATKFAIGGPDGTGVLQTGNGRRAMFRSVEGSLRRLGTDYIDLLWVHFPDFVTPLEEIVRGFDDLARAGKILYAGLSNFPAWMTARAATLAEMRGLIPVSGVQFEYSLVERSADRENLPMAEAMGLGAALWSPLGGGVLSGKYRSEYGGQAHRLGSSRAHRRRAGEGSDGRRSARDRRRNRRSGRASRGGVAARAAHVSHQPHWFRSSARAPSNRPIPIWRHWTSNSTMISIVVSNRSAASIWGSRTTRSPSR